LEAVALAVIAGTSQDSVVVPRPPIVAEPAGLSVSPDAPYLILGWNDEIERSRRLAGEILEKLARRSSEARPVAVFRVHVRSGSSGQMPLSEEGARGPSGLRMLVPSADFMVSAGATNDPGNSIELARAHRWGAHTFTVWRATQGERFAPAPRTESVSAPSRWMGWCGAME